MNGDLTKVWYADNLTAAAKRLLQNIEHNTRKIPGTQEVRKLMRYQTHACRIRRGVPIFITISPDEKHNMLMLRLSRTRKSDPVNKIDNLSAQFGGLRTPQIDADFASFGLPLEALLELVPTYDDRRAMIARDSLASVDGFRLWIVLLLEYIFGVRLCLQCPDCLSQATRTVHVTPGHVNHRAATPSHLLPPYLSLSSLPPFPPRHRSPP